MVRKYSHHQVQLLKLGKEITKTVDENHTNKLILQYFKCGYATGEQNLSFPMFRIDRQNLSVYK